MAEYNRSRPSDAFTQPPDIEYFEQVRQSGASGESAFLVCCDLRIGANSLAMTLEKELSGEISEGHPDFASTGCTALWEARADSSEPSSGRRRPTPPTSGAILTRRYFSARLAAASTRGAPRFHHYEVLDQLGSAEPK